MTTFRYTEQTWRDKAPGQCDAEWTFKDGVHVHMKTPAHYTRYRLGSMDYTHQREFTRKARVYAHSDAPFNVREDLENRFRRPFQALKPGTIEALQRIGVEFDKLRWDQRAGCSCGCSPGFVVEGGPVGVEFWVTLTGAPTVDETKEARVLA